jgi:hypothetical protein
VASRIKFNGYRVQFHLENGHKKAYTRNGLDWTKRFSAIAGDIPGQAIVDCEVVVIREGLRVSLFSGGAGGTPPGCYLCKRAIMVAHHGKYVSARRRHHAFVRQPRQRGRAHSVKPASRKMALIPTPALLPGLVAQLPNVA